MSLVWTHLIPPIRGSRADERQMPSPPRPRRGRAVAHSTISGRGSDVHDVLFMAPGRLNLFELDGYRVVVDYAHNPPHARLGEFVDRLAEPSAGAHGPSSLGAGSASSPPPATGATRTSSSSARSPPRTSMRSSCARTRTTAAATWRHGRAHRAAHPHGAGRWVARHDGQARSWTSWMPRARRSTRLARATSSSSASSRQPGLEGAPRRSMARRARPMACAPWSASSVRGRGRPGPLARLPQEIAEPLGAHRPVPSDSSQSNSSVRSTWP